MANVSNSDFDGIFECDLPLSMFDTRPDGEKCFLTAPEWDAAVETNTSSFITETTN